MGFTLMVMNGCGGRTAIVDDNERDGRGGGDRDGGIGSEGETAGSVLDGAPQDKPGTGGTQNGATEPLGDWLALFSVKNQIWATNANGEVLTFSKDQWPLTNANMVLTPLSEHALTDVWAASPTAVWVVSEAGEIFRWDGSSWETALSADRTGAIVLRSVWGSSERDIWAVGDRGVMLHWDGTSWSFFESGTTRDLTQVLGTSQSDVLAAGYRVLLHYDGGKRSAYWTEVGSSDDIWQDLYPGPNGTLWVSGYFSVTTYRGGGGGPRMDVYQSGSLLESLTTSQMCGWATPQGQIIGSDRCDQPRCSIRLLKRGEPESWDDEWVPIAETAFPVTDLWGDEHWIWAVGEQGMLARLPTPM